MKLSTYLRKFKDDEEITVYDDTFDCEMYFYNTIEIEDEFDESLMELASKLTVTDYSVAIKSCSVNFYDLIEKNLENIKKADLFIVNDVDVIMNDMDSIISGNVSERWLHKFVNAIEVY